MKWMIHELYLILSFIFLKCIKYFLTDMYAISDKNLELIKSSRLEGILSKKY